MNRLNGKQIQYFYKAIAKAEENDIELSDDFKYKLDHELRFLNSHTDLKQIGKICIATLMSLSTLCVLGLGTYGLVCLIYGG